MKKISVLLLILIVSVFMLAGCGASGKPAGSETAPKEGKIKIVSTIFPPYDWTREIIKGSEDKIELTLLMDSGVDLHSFQPSAEDIAKISECDIFIHVGGESDEWVEDVLKETKNKNMRVITFMELLGESVKYEELVEGMEEHEHEHDHDADHDHDEHDDHDDHDAEHEHDDKDHDHDHDHDKEEDEHVWLSLKNAQVCVGAISAAIADADPEHKDAYIANADAYGKKLAELDGKYKTAVDGARVKTLVFGDRFPFRYMTDDYGLTYYAAFSGCSAESEASFETVTFLAKKLDELGLSSIMTIDGSNGKIAETVVSNTKAKNQKIRTLDSMQSTTAKDIEAGATYLSKMEENLETLKAALE